MAVTIDLTDVAERPARVAPPTISAPAGSFTSLDVSWSEPSRNGGPEIIGYEVWYKLWYYTSWTEWPHSGTETATTITGLTSGTTYDVQVRALNGETPGDWSLDPFASGKPSVPTNVNHAPEFPDERLIRTVAENTAANRDVGAAIPAATDGNPNDTLTYTMEGADAGSFTFDPAARQIKTKTGETYDYEGKSSYSVTIKVWDGTASDTVAVTINLTDVAEQPAQPAAPTVSAPAGSLTSLEVRWSEPSRNGGPAIISYEVGYRAVSTVFVSDWQHSGMDTATTITGLTPETEYLVVVRALNGEWPSDWSDSVTGRTNAPNRAPEFPDERLIRTVAENTVANRDVGAAIPAATDGNPNDTLTYTMEGADAGSFTFDPAARQIKTKTGETYDYEGKSSYSVTIKVWDGTASDTVAVTINLTDVVEAPGKPHDLTAESVRDGIVLRWQEPAEGTVTGYQILRRELKQGTRLEVYVDDTGSTDTTYTDTEAQAGVRYAYRVKARNGNALSKLSNPASGARPASNTPATGAPVISGTAQVGETLTADTSGIADADGLTNVSYSYQWLSSRDTEIDGATGSAYTLQVSDLGRIIKVRVSFTDDAGNAETLTSEGTDPVEAAPLPPLIASLENTPDSHDGKADFTFELRFSEEFALSYQTLRDHAFTVTGGTVRKAKRLEQGSNMGWRITVRPDGNGDVTVALPETSDCDAQGAICTGDGRMLSSRQELTVSGPDQ